MSIITTMRVLTVSAVIFEVGGTDRRRLPDDCEEEDFCTLEPVTSRNSHEKEKRRRLECVANVKAAGSQQIALLNAPRMNEMSKRDDSLTCRRTYCVLRVDSNKTSLARCAIRIAEQRARLNTKVMQSVDKHICICFAGESGTRRRKTSMCRTQRLRPHIRFEIAPKFRCASLIRPFGYEGGLLFNVIVNLEMLCSR